MLVPSPAAARPLLAPDPARRGPCPAPDEGPWLDPGPPILLPLRPLRFGPPRTPSRWNHWKTRMLWRLHNMSDPSLLMSVHHLVRSSISHPSILKTSVRSSFVRSSVFFICIYFIYICVYNNIYTRKFHRDFVLSCYNVIDLTAQGVQEKWLIFFSTSFQYFASSPSPTLGLLMIIQKIAGQ